jgi:hypothetical protein
MTISHLSRIAILCVGLALAACGYNTTDRALSGAALGAGAGAATSAVVGGGVLTGALLGAGVGAAAGALTDPDDIQLGRPVWR